MNNATREAIKLASELFFEAVSKVVPEDFRPCGDRILARAIQPDFVRSEAGLFIVSDERPQFMVVIAVGPGLVNKSGKREPIPVKVGDTFLAGKFIGLPLPDFRDDHLRLVRVGDVLAVLEVDVGKEEEKEG